MYPMYPDLVIERTRKDKNLTYIIAHVAKITYTIIQSMTSIYHNPNCHTFFQIVTLFCPFLFYYSPKMVPFGQRSQIVTLFLKKV